MMILRLQRTMGGGGEKVPMIPKCCIVEVAAKHPLAVVAFAMQVIEIPEAPSLTAGFIVLA